MNFVLRLGVVLLGYVLVNGSFARAQQPCVSCFKESITSCASFLDTPTWPDNPPPLFCPHDVCLEGACQSETIIDQIRYAGTGDWGVLRVTPKYVAPNEPGVFIKGNVEPFPCKWRVSCDGCEPNPIGGGFRCAAKTTVLRSIPLFDPCLDSSTPPAPIPCTGDLEA